jgi:hypothetical protein
MWSIPFARATGGTGATAELLSNEASVVVSIAATPLLFDSSDMEGGEAAAEEGEEEGR